MFFDTRPKVTVEVAQTGESYLCATDESLLKGMLRLGRKGIPVGCVNGGCGVCKVRIVEGQVKSLRPGQPGPRVGRRRGARLHPGLPRGTRHAGQAGSGRQAEQAFSKGLAKAGGLPSS